MKLKNVSKEILETMPFDDIAYMILKENGKKMKTDDIFKIICDELNLGGKAFENQIGDFFALLATEKRFIQLKKGFWDLRENHTAEISIKEIEDEMEEEILIEDTEDDIDNNDENADYYDELDDTEDEEPDDDLKDLVVVDEGYEDDMNL